MAKTTDFLLGLTSIPDRKNYDIGELGLSAQAARNLYTRKVNADVVNRLLEHPKFPRLTAMIAQCLDDTFADGIAAQEAARAVSLYMVLPRQIEVNQNPKHIHVHTAGDEAGYWL